MREAPPRDERMLKEFLDRQHQESIRTTQRLDEARRKLEEGTPPDEVIRFLRESRGAMLADRFVERWRTNERPDSPKPLFDRGHAEGHPPGAAPGGPPLPPEQLDELLQFVREVRPEFAANLEQWKTDEPRAFRAVVGRLIPKAIDTFRSRHEDKELFELRKAELRETIFVVEKAHEIRRWHMENKGQEVPTDKKRMLRDLMSKAYDARIQVREYEAAHLGKRLESSNKQIQEAKDAKDAMLDRALVEVLRTGPGRPGRSPEEAESHPFGDDAKRPLGDRPANAPPRPKDKSERKPEKDPEPSSPPERPR